MMSSLSDHLRIEGLGHHEQQIAVEIAESLGLEIAAGTPHQAIAKVLGRLLSAVIGHEIAMSDKVASQHRAGPRRV